jgi:hypothetical protein
MSDDKDTKEILQAIDRAEARVSELVSNGRQHVVIVVENMEREVKEQKGLLLWLKSWAQRLHK